jgi:hypothetical protein
MDQEHVLVFFQSPDGREGWKPVERDNIPDWLRDDDIIQRLIDGEMANNATQNSGFWRVTVVHREPVAPLALPMVRNFAYLHREGCGSPAFFLQRRPKPGEPVPPSHEIAYADGSHPAPNGQLRCGSCGGAVWKIGTRGWQLNDIVAVT